MSKDNDDYVISEREKKAWQTGKKRVRRERPNLTVAQRIEFLELVARMASSTEFERRLDLTTGDVNYYSKLLNVESADEARRLAKKMKKENAEITEASVVEETKRVREAEQVAQQRLEELESKRNASRPVREVDAVAIKREDKERQKRLTAQESEVDVPTKEWRLPLEGTAAQRQEQIDRFRREIVYRGFNLVCKKYGTTNAQVKYEAKRLGLDINWDLVRR